MLSPLLFSIFINSVTSYFQYCSYHLYADDLQLYLSFKPEDINKGIINMNADLDAVYSWANNYGLLLNPDKTQVILIGRDRYISQLNLESLPPVILNGKSLAYLTSEKNLGIYITNNLS